MKAKPAQRTVTYPARQRAGLGLHAPAVIVALTPALRRVHLSSGIAIASARRWRPNVARLLDRHLSDVR
jgi:hypothetical protein